MIKKIKRLQKVFPHREKKKIFLKMKSFNLDKFFNVSFKGQMI